MSRRRFRDDPDHNAEKAARQARLDEKFFEQTGLHWHQVACDEGSASPPRSRRAKVPRRPSKTPAVPDRIKPAKAKPTVKAVKQKDVSGLARTRGAKKRAKRISESELKLMLEVAGRGNSPYSDRAVLLLSYDAGLRACEIADLRVDTFLTASGKVGKTLDVMPGTAKYGRGRPLPMTPRLRKALADLHREHPAAEFVAFSNRRGHLKYRNSQALRSAYKKIAEDAGLKGVSSHSGRRSFGTEHARLANLAGGSIRDVQAMLGHAFLSSTEAYLDPGEAVVRMVELRAARKRKK